MLKLQSLNLSNNKLSSIVPGSFIDLINVVSIDLSFNEFSEFNSKIFEFMFRLQDLNLNGNKLQGVKPEMVKYIQGKKNSGKFWV